jgi:hypothetical protein
MMLLVFLNDIDAYFPSLICWDSILPEFTGSVSATIPLTEGDSPSSADEQE